MKFLLFVEGHTEKRAVGQFLARWLNARLSRRVGLVVINLRGSGRFGKGVVEQAGFHLARDTAGQIVAAIGLLDLYRGADWPAEKVTPAERYAWGVRHYEKTVGNDRFRMFFAVHETEAWLLSDPGIFRPEVGRRIRPEWSAQPEEVDFDDPPARRLQAAYRVAANRAYRKALDGPNLFARLDPQTAYEKCPHLKALLDTMLELAQDAGL